MQGTSLERVGPHRTEPDPEEAAAQAAEPGLRPALFAGYRQLSKLRYDYPLILAEPGTDGAIVRSLSATVDRVLREIAPPGSHGRRLRSQMLWLEGRIRTLISRRVTGSLSRLWRWAATDLMARTEESARDRLGGDLGRVRDALGSDGDVIDCDAETPARVMVHLWTAIEAAKAKRFRRKVEGLILRLSDILRADFMKSPEARDPEALRASVGGAFEAAFDFQAMSRILGNGSAIAALPEHRRRRIHEVLSILKSQRFYAPGRASGADPGRPAPYGFLFDGCTAALDAFRARLPEIVEIVKAIAIAELEIVNRYQASVHDAFFAWFDETALDRDDLALFPSYLVCLRDGRSDPADIARAFEVLASELPVKILLQTDDILGGPSPAPDRSSFGRGGARLAAMAVGANGAYVFQTAASNLYRWRQRLHKGLSYEGPALFSVFSGSTPRVSGVPSYLLAAAATESRAFPTFTYDPAAGPDLAARFHVDDNPQADADWPTHALNYEDQAHQRIGEEVRFTHVDFAACDPRYAKYCVPVSRDRWHDAMIPVSDYIALEAGQESGHVPYVLLSDADSSLRRAIVDDKLIAAARRCNQTWRSLQELGGIGNSHARRLLARERQAWEQEKERELADLHARARTEPASGVAAAPAPAAEPVAESEIAEPAEISPDQPSIETARCTTCNECTQINNKMFVYDDNMQAYIADLDAGTYRQLVEAAESCQVSIIHPGKPKNPDEPGLDELIARAAPFN